MANEENLKPFVEGDDPRRNTNGRPKGGKNLATLVRELEAEDFDWSKVPIKQKDAVKSMGSPWRAIVFTAVAKAVSGDVKAMEWLRKSGYGDKLDIMSDGKRIEAPLIISAIKPRDVISETETTESNRDSE